MDEETGSGLCAKTLHASLIAFQHVSKHARVTLNQSLHQWDKVATQENWKNRSFALTFFDFLVPFS